MNGNGPTSAPAGSSSSQARQQHSSLGSSTGSLQPQQSTKDLLTAALQTRVASNNYIAHLKIWETVSEPGQAAARKARYLILAVQRDTGKVTVNKAKRNANGTFSIGKDWDLNTLREVTVDQPDHFTLTLTRSYSWQTERSREQTLFLQTIVKVYRKYTGDGNGPVITGLEGFSSTSSSNGQASAAASTTANTQRPNPTIDTHVERTRSRESPASASGSAQPRSATSDVRSAHTTERMPQPPQPVRSASATVAVPTISTTFADGDDEKNAEPPIRAPDNARLGSVSRRPTIGRQVSANAVMTPSSHDTELSQNRDAKAGGMSSSASMGTSPAQSFRSLPPEDGMAVDNTQAPVSKPYNLSEPSDSRYSLDKQSEAALMTPRPGQRFRKPSVDSGSSLSVVTGGGDARARLSSIEPVRGGAAYEKMLLAGTGLGGLTEGDEEEEEQDGSDVYGGAELADGDGLTKEESIKHKRSVKRRNRDARDVASMHRDVLPDEDVDTTLANVEEILEGFEFRNNMATNISARKGGAKAQKGTADIIEARLLDELTALDAANIHAIIESDDRVQFVVQHMEQALQQLDMIDSMIAGYKMQLNARAEDISHIESQNRGLQVQTSNQRALSAEIEKLLSTVNVEDDAVEALLHVELDTDEGIGQLEAASAALYKAILQAKRTQDDTRSGDPNAMGLAAATERLGEYNAIADEFAKRLLAFLTEAFNQQTRAILHDPQRLQALAGPTPTILEQSSVEAVLGRYCGLLLYTKEVSPSYFSRVSAAYFASASERYRGEISTLFSSARQQIARINTEEANDANFSPPPTQTSTALRAGTIRRATGRGDRAAKSSRAGAGQNEALPSAFFARVLEAITPLVIKEQTFISDLLHINNNAITFADYMDLEVLFRRRAADIFSSSSSLTGPLKSMKDAMELVFGFLAPEWQQLIDNILAKDKMQVVGMLAALDRAVMEAEQLNNDFLSRSFNKLQMRLAQQLDKFVGEQIRAIEQTKLTAKKRKGVVHFIKAFPHFVERIEQQLINAETLQIRNAVDAHYDHICKTMFDALQSMAIPKMEGGTFGTLNTDEDKGQLNHHVIVIENMFHFVKEFNRIKTGQIPLAPQIKRAQAMLDEALHAYVQSALRRPLGKMMDYGDGVDALLRSTPANEVPLHSAYSRQAAKRLVKEYSSKDIRKSIEALSRRVQKHFDEEDITMMMTGSVDSATGGTSGLSGSNAASGGLGANSSSLVDMSGITADEIAEVLALVWRHLEDGFTHECERMVRILRECYSQDNKLLADYTMEDVRRPFAGNAPAGRRR